MLADPMDAAASPPPSRVVSERTLIGLIGAMQFVNILDFMMVMPLGPDFAAALGMPTSQLGYIGGSYTAAAAVSGIVGAFFLDRFDRRTALAFSMFGLVLGTAAGAFATSFTTLLCARVIAGIFGGPATSVALSIIADVIPPERRGRAMGSVMGAFSAASVLGVPAGLELARLGGWRAPFIGVAALGFVVNLLGFFFLPPLKKHLERPPRVQSVKGLVVIFTRPLALVAYAVLGLSMMSAFSLIPNISGHLQQNLHYPRAAPLERGGGVHVERLAHAGSRQHDRGHAEPLALRHRPRAVHSATRLLHRDGCQEEEHCDVADMAALH
jgi:predicted MFS family arabinose efflux permease